MRGGKKGGHLGWTDLAIQSAQPLVICMGHLIAIDVILVSLFMEVLILSLSKVLLCVLIEHEGSR